MRPVIGVSISTRNVSFHERFIIREIMPSVLMNVLSSTLTFRHTVLPIRVVSLDNLDVISPAQKINRNDILFCPVLLCSTLICLFLLHPFVLLYSVLFIFPCLVHYVMSGLVLSFPEMSCLVLTLYMSCLVLICSVFMCTEKLFIQHICMLYYERLTCLYGLKESNFLFGQSPKQLDFNSACVGTDGTK